MVVEESVPKSNSRLLVGYVVYSGHVMSHDCVLDHVMSSLADLLLFCSTHWFSSFTFLSSYTNPNLCV